MTQTQFLSLPCQLWERNQKKNIVYSLVPATALPAFSHRTKAVFGDFAEQIWWVTGRSLVSFQGIGFTFQSSASSTSNYLPDWEDGNSRRLRRRKRDTDGWETVPCQSFSESFFLLQILFPRKAVIEHSHSQSWVLCLLCHETPTSVMFTGC